MSVAKHGERFFNIMASIMLGLIILGFGPSTYRTVTIGSGLTLSLIFHAIIFTAWYLLFWYQTQLISTGNNAKHMALGKASVWLVILIIITGILASLDAWGRQVAIAPMSAEQFMMVTWADLVIFLTGYSLAYKYRTKTDLHKRLMLVSSIIMLTPATARIAITFGSSQIVSAIVPLLMIVTLAVYDIYTLKKVHWGTITGLALFFLKVFLLLVVGATALWYDIVHIILGP